RNAATGLVGRAGPAAGSAATAVVLSAACPIDWPDGCPAGATAWIAPDTIPPTMRGGVPSVFSGPLIWIVNVIPGLPQLALGAKTIGDPFVPLTLPSRLLALS